MWVKQQCSDRDCPGCRLSYRPEKWRQRVCHQKSSHQQSLKRAASLGDQTLAGTPQPSSKHRDVEIKDLYSCNDSVVPQDFEMNAELKIRVIGFLEEVMHDPELLTQERKAAANIIRWDFCYHGSERLKEQ